MIADEESRCGGCRGLWSKIFGHSCRGQTIGWSAALICHCSECHGTLNLTHADLPPMSMNGLAVPTGDAYDPGDSSVSAPEPEPLHWTFD